MTLIRFVSAAETELDEASAFYDKQRFGLGARFLEAVYEAVSRIRENPATGILSLKGTRMQNVKQFPYGVSRAS